MAYLVVFWRKDVHYRLRDGFFMDLILKNFMTEKNSPICIIDDSVFSLPYCLKLFLFVIYIIICHGSRMKFVQNMDCYTGITNLLDGWWWKFFFVKMSGDGTNFWKERVGMEKFLMRTGDGKISDDGGWE